MEYYVESDFTNQLCKELLAQYGTVNAAARAIHPFCRSERLGIPVTWYSPKKWIKNGLRKNGNPAEVLQKDLQQSSVITQSAASTIIYNHAPFIAHPIRVSVVISDVQFGYLRNTQTGDLEPIHDPIAISVANRIVADLRPVGLYWIGDYVDWPSFSRWQKYPEYFGCLQPTIDNAHIGLGETIAAAGHQCNRRVMVGSNHQQRPEKFILEHNMDALSIRRAGEPPTGWPVFSEQYLLRYDDLGIEFSGHYPGGLYFVSENIALTHAPTKKLEIGADIIHGHTHKLTTHTWAQYRADGRHNFFMYDCGCLCQLTGTESLQHMMVSKVPSDRARNEWAQGIAVINQIDTKVPKHSIDQIKISKGVAIYGGQVYQAQTVEQN